MTTTTSSASSGSYLRRQSLFGTDDRIVLDIGSRVSKIGFSGEARPREIFYTLDGMYENGKSILEHTEGLLWTSDMLRCRSDEQRRLRTVRLRSRLTIILRDIFYRRLMIDPKQRNIIIIENVLMPDVVKQVMGEILFGNLLVPSVCFVPLHLACSIATGRLTAMVLDVGYQEASLLPVCFGRAMMPTHFINSSRAGKKLARRLQALLVNYASYLPTPARGDNDRIEAVKMSKQSLTLSILDEIIAKALIVADDAPTRRRSLATSAPVEEAEESAAIQELENRYNSASIKAKDMIISVPSSARGPISPPTQPSTLDQYYSDTTSTSKRSIVIPGWIRERAAEVLFEDGDEDDPSLVQMVLQTLIKLPVDLRVPMASNIYLAGGISMLPGLAHRLRVELVQRLEACKGNRGISPTALTTSRVGTLRLSPTARKLQDNATDHREEGARISQRERHQYGPISGLSDTIAVLNDHSPRALPTGELLGGAAPAFSSNLSAWIGGSLMGTLRVETTSQKTREDWDNEQEEMAARDHNRKEELSKRPSLGTGRGSFLGTVTGLDLGTYGPLSAGARGTFTSPKGTPSPRSSKVA